MMELKAKKLRMKCAVRGCRNVDTYLITYYCESGGSVIICPDCLNKAKKLIDGATDKAVKGQVKKDV